MWYYLRILLIIHSFNGLQCNVAYYFNIEDDTEIVHLSSLKKIIAPSVFQAWLGDLLVIV